MLCSYYQLAEVNKNNGVVPPHSYRQQGSAAVHSYMSRGKSTPFKITISPTAELELMQAFILKNKLKLKSNRNY